MGWPRERPEGTENWWSDAIPLLLFYFYFYDQQSRSYQCQQFDEDQFLRWRDIVILKHPLSNNLKGLYTLEFWPSCKHVKSFESFKIERQLGNNCWLSESHSHSIIPPWLTLCCSWPQYSDDFSRTWESKTCVQRSWFINISFIYQLYLKVQIEDAHRTQISLSLALKNHWNCCRCMWVQHKASKKGFIPFFSLLNEEWLDTVPMVPAKPSNQTQELMATLNPRCESLNQVNMCIYIYIYIILDGNQLTAQPIYDLRFTLF